MKILIFEESDLLTEIIYKAIEFTDSSKVKKSKKFTEAKKEIDDSNFDIIILNSKISSSNNNDLINYIREKNKFTYIIVISSETNLDYIKKLYEMGIDYLVPIPFDPSILKLLIDRVYERINQFHCVYRGENE